jgi:uncharacterized membrane protein YbaN (DUF454 family)
MKRVNRLLILGLGWVLIVLGVLGLFLPVLQGVLFILVGLYLLSRESTRARQVLDRLRARYPSVEQTLERAKERFAFLRGRKQKAPGGAPGA